METFITIKDKDGVLRPMAFIVRLNDAGEYTARSMKLGEGDKLVVVEIKEVSDY